MKILNPKINFDYKILDTFEAGIKLTGGEVKSVRGGRMSLEGSFIKVIGNELYLVNSQIFAYEYARPEGYDPKRTRKLLLHKKEILVINTRSGSAGLTIVPIECYNRGGFLKLKIGLAKGKKEYEKREKIKKRDLDREVQRVLRGKI